MLLKTVISFISGSMSRYLTDKGLLLILSAFLFVSSMILSQDIAPDEILRNIVSQRGQAEVTVGYTGRKQLEYLSGNLSVASVKDKKIHIILSPRTIEWFISQHYEYEIIVRDDSKGLISAADIGEAAEWESYPTYTQYDSIMRKFPADFPLLCRLDTIGTSIYGKLILALKISDNAGSDEDEPEVFYTSTIHGDETGGFVLMLHLADYILKNYNTNTRVKNLVDNLEIWINPLANPDGAYLTGNVITSSATRDNANAVDLNRDFPDPDWNQTPKQKETIDMMRFLRSRHFVLSANFHSGAEVVNYPWDRWIRLHADNDWFYRISRSYADTVHIHSVPGYMTYLENGVTNGFDWYRINGGRQDFVTYELHGREVTIELDDTYITPVAQLNNLWEYNRRSLLHYLENAMYGLHGKVVDALTSVPVPARIFIKGHDKDSSHVYSDTLTGSFVRLIAPGSWDLLITADGYQDLMVNDVVVAEGQTTDLLVEMYSSLNPVDTVETPVPVLYPNPAGSILRAVLPERQYGRINIMIFNVTGVKVADYYTVTMKDVPVLIDVRYFPAGTYVVVFTNTVTKVVDKGRFVVIPR